jgi:hypothetical protein
MVDRKGSKSCLGATQITLAQSGSVFEKPWKLAGLAILDAGGRAHSNSRMQVSKSIQHKGRTPWSWSWDWTAGSGHVNILFNVYPTITSVVRSYRSAPSDHLSVYTSDLYPFSTDVASWSCPTRSSKVGRFGLSIIIRHAVRNAR